MNLPPPAFENKIVAPAELAQRVATLPRPLVFTNGCFDILHRGHVTYLAQAAALGAAMVVALNSDASVRRLGKGEDRPVNALADRLAVMAALGSVALVTWFEEDTPLARILDCRPDVLVKGGDWPVDKIVGAAEVSAGGGRVVSIPFRHQTSTTALLEKVRRL
ncbi:adenylyltransferase/cytidyltransferase family protein [Rhodocyclus tenuis]|uniref:RfaE bifunctional protein nucleotidyltransferase chain/domain n=1 Tax=Rhodocyclus tenuis TaxID=1066 RepID=A0A840G911_RHOTE|nr:adenylyltransferase/cytidyltransferase family protein [Rhodocyclus tenuis]MBB4248823.1 rfaE bifunctional protein nucleotidyltransferase chain/domain [Rhodocyclus tenuis]MBK1680779.1 D-glycero-beta-D-manno-heptose 1-phosphate adenylyltransferase [Rhodocyclus tenuis]